MNRESSTGDRHSDSTHSGESIEERASEGPAVQISDIEPDETDRLVDHWVDLADDQQSYGSHLVGEENRNRVTRLCSRFAATDQLLVARKAPDDDDPRAIVGFVMWRFDTGGYVTDCTRGVIENIYVRPDARGQGIGTRLLAAAEGRLDAAGADVVSLEALAENDRAKRFYRRQGYEPHRIQFEKALDPEPE